MAHPRENHTPAQATTDQLGCLPAVIRLAWLVAGGLALAILTLLIARRGALSPLDAAFWGVVVLTAVLRLVDITRFGGLTADGEPATLRTWRVYVLGLLLVSGGLWGLAHTVLPNMVH